MYKKIMVPLDGSELAECVFPHVEAFIKGFNLSEVVLVRVMDALPVSTQIEGVTDIKEHISKNEEDKKNPPKNTSTRPPNSSSTKERPCMQKFYQAG